MNPVTVVIGGVGALLIYSAIKGKDPRSIIADALGGNKSAKAKAAASAAADTPDTPDTPLTPVQRTGN
jgi:hypothetical protein